MFHVIHCSFHDPNLRAGHGENLTPPGAAGLAGHDGGADGGGPLQPPHHLAGRPGHVHRGRPGPVQRLLWLHGSRAAGVHCGYGAVFCHIAPLKKNIFASFQLILSPPQETGMVVEEMVYDGADCHCR